LRLKQHFTYKYGTQLTQREGGQFWKKKHKKNPNPKPKPKPISFKTKATAPTPHPGLGFSLRRPAPLLDLPPPFSPPHRQHPPFPHLARLAHLFFVPTFPLPKAISFSLWPSISSPHLTSFSSTTPEQICLPPPWPFPSSPHPLSTATNLHHNRPVAARHSGAHRSQIGPPSSSSSSPSTVMPTASDLAAAHPSTPSSASLPDWAEPFSSSDTPPRPNTAASPSQRICYMKKEREADPKEEETYLRMRESIVLLRFLLFCKSQRRRRCKREKEKKPISTALFPGCFRSDAWIHAPPLFTSPETFLATVPAFPESFPVIPIVLGVVL